MTRIPIQRIRRHHALLSASNSSSTNLPNLLTLTGTSVPRTAQSRVSSLWNSTQVRHRIEFMGLLGLNPSLASSNNDGVTNLFKNNVEASLKLLQAESIQSLPTDIHQTNRMISGLSDLDNTQLNAISNLVKNIAGINKKFAIMKFAITENNNDNFFNLLAQHPESITLAIQSTNNTDQVEVELNRLNSCSTLNEVNNRHAEHEIYTQIIGYGNLASNNNPPTLPTSRNLMLEFNSAEDIPEEQPIINIPQELVNTITQLDWESMPYDLKENIQEIVKCPNLSNAYFAKDRMLIQIQVYNNDPRNIKWNPAIFVTDFCNDVYKLFSNLNTNLKPLFNNLPPQEKQNIKDALAQLINNPNNQEASIKLVKSCFVAFIPQLKQRYGNYEDTNMITIVQTEKNGQASKVVTSFMHAAEHEFTYIAQATSALNLEDIDYLGLLNDITNS